ncbi:MAG: (5-formylfuran-3-yl)methyl phosphate synthase [Ignisphaera sp.]|uniref:(5-formylfuran-3-yl)methyl phosphate synthase n=1 Tax=Ignisphaera aggregans TaxID=334771 RepID=A0A7C4NT60_9CREN
MHSIKLLISVKSLDEVKDVVEGGADIIDVKDPSNGSLGLPDLSLVKEVIDVVRSLGSKEVSMALGDVDKENKALNYIAFVGGVLNVDYIKVGMAVIDFDVATRIARNIADTVSVFPKLRIVLVGYADYLYTQSIEPLKIVDVAIKTEAEGVMIDTLRKGRWTTFDVLSLEYLRKFAEKAHEASLLAAIAGSIRIEHISLCMKLGFDVVGVRGAVCTGGRSGKISRELVKQFKLEIEKYKALRSY